LINAITHRDYSLEGRGIEVKIFDDRLEILSPGKLLSSISIKDLEELKGVHQSRNTYIARALREFGYIRELGEGIKRIFELMKSNDLVKPKIESPNKSFIITLYHKFVYSKEEKLWLENFSDIELTREEKTVVRLGVGGELVSPKLIWDNVGIVDTDAYRQLIESLRKKGILISEISKLQAIDLAKKGKNKDKKAIPRFRIVVPNKESKTLSTKKEKDNYADDSEYATIFIRNLPLNVIKEEVNEIFQEFGEISDIRIPINFYTGKSKGFAFVEFEKKESAKKVLDNAPIVINGRKVYPQEYKK
jgi:ATP-dependent DNA helicase RecG